MNILSLMKTYFEPGSLSRNVMTEAPGRDVPIAPKKETWEKIEDPEALRRIFELSSPEKLVYFLEDVVQMQESLGHHGKLLIEGTRVLAQVTTHSLAQVTELDIEWATKVDEIYNDVESI